MRTGRVEAFGAGVPAVLITITVLELPEPAGDHWSDLSDDRHPLIASALSCADIATGGSSAGSRTSPRSPRVTDG